MDRNGETVFGLEAGAPGETICLHMGFFLSVPPDLFRMLYRGSADCRVGGAGRAKRQPEAAIHAATGSGNGKRKNISVISEQ